MKKSKHPANNAQQKNPTKTKTKNKQNKASYKYTTLDNDNGIHSDSDDDGDEDIRQPPQYYYNKISKLGQFYNGVNMDQIDILQLDAKQSATTQNIATLSQQQSNTTNNNTASDATDVNDPNDANNNQLNRKINIIIYTLMIVLIGVLLAHYYMSVVDRVDDSVGNVGNIEQGDIIGNQSVSKTRSETNIKKNGRTVDTHPVDQHGFDIKIPETSQQSTSKTTTAITQAKIPTPTPTPRPRSTPANQQHPTKSINLRDFQIDPIYINAPLQIKLIFNQMITRPQDKRRAPNSIFTPTQKAYFAYRLYQQPQNQKYLQAQYYYYENKYEISKYDQYQFCIVAPGRNLVKNNRYRRFIDSIQRQNYTDYKLIYVDDVSEDNSAEQLEKYIKQTDGPLNKMAGSNYRYEGTFIADPDSFNKEQDQRRLVIIKNKERLYALANRNQAIRKFCPEQSIVLDVDADDAIIGKQAFKFVNAVYHRQQVWMFNSVFIYDKSLGKQVTTGPQDGVPLQILQNNRYRTSLVWKTSQLRTFKAKLFNKIDEKDFKDQNGTFYQWASDVFTQQPLVQLAGPKHYKHLYEIVYFYDWNFDHTTVYKRRHYRDIAFMQTPYLPLQSLDDKAEKVKDFITPQIIVNQYEKDIRQAMLQAKKYKRPPPF